MESLLLVLVGVLVGLTTALFGFGGGFVTVPIITVADAGLGDRAAQVAAATSALVMLVNAAVATASTRPEVLRALRGRTGLLLLLAAGGAVGAAAAGGAPEAALRWGFVAYVGATVVDLLVRPGFFGGSRRTDPDRTGATGVPTALGLPIGAIAAFLGVGGSVLTVPVMRRSGAPMAVATTLANPLTLAIVAPAVAVVLLGPADASAPGVVGAVDVRAALALLTGAMPVIVLLRRRPPRVPEAVHAWGYLLLLVAAACTVALA
ncbi:TSUP family transporter [Saccharopolyspora griseoalba]|uniref:Probable membrane transporter protein n=1 Tax=Saccharopolyspora griseoalba TaxID=1431848 RepID=A0ABW2LR57_9PSEU